MLLLPGSLPAKSFGNKLSLKSKSCLPAWHFLICLNKKSVLINAVKQYAHGNTGPEKKKNRNKKIYIFEIIKYKFYSLTYMNRIFRRHCNLLYL